MPDYTYIDQPQLLQYLFYPRPDHCAPPAGSFDCFVTVEEDVRVACRFYAADEEWPWLLYFHGNGEVAGDYDNIAPFYQLCPVNLIVADYRGYGFSQGEPTITNLIKDADAVYREVGNQLQKMNYKGRLWVMGRSMGSIAALELAHRYPDQIPGIIIESGFASVTRLITHLGIMNMNPEFEKVEKACLEMIAGIQTPALILHGDQDTLVPWQEGKLIYDTLGSSKKEMVTIRGASHNDIIFKELQTYFGAIKQFVNS